MKMMVSIGFMNTYIEERINKLRDDYNIEIVMEDSPIDLTGIDLILATGFSEDLIDSADQLKCVFIPFTGTNRFPVEQLEAKGINVINTHAKAHIVAERAMALTLTLMGKVMVYHNALKEQGRWLTREFWGEEFWNSLYNKRCGIVGMGHIGENISKLLKPFGCTIINLERDAKKDLADEYFENIEAMMSSCDILYLTCALNDETTHLINKNNIHLLENKFIINIARGPVIEEEVLYISLKDRIIAGVGQDVWYKYPKGKEGTWPSQYPIHEFENIVMSPHASCHAYEAKDAYYEGIFNQVEKYLEKIEGTV